MTDFEGVSPGEVVIFGRFEGNSTPLLNIIGARGDVPVEFCAHPPLVWSGQHGTHKSFTAIGDWIPGGGMRDYSR